MPLTLPRTYQGRVSSLDFLSDAKKSPETLQTFTQRQLDDPTVSPLWRSHDAFQSACNYYLFCFAVLAQSLPEEHPLQKMRQQIRKSWSTFPRPIRNAISMRDSLRCVLNLSANATFEEAEEAIDLPEGVDSTTLALAVESLLHDLGGDSKIQQGGRTYFPFFCVAKTKANFPRSRVNQLKEEGKAILPSLLWSLEQSSPSELLEQLPFEYFANPTTTNTRLVGEEFQDKLKEALTHEHQTTPLPEDLFSQLESQIEQLDPDSSCPAYTGGSINKEALKRRFFLFLLLKYVSPEQTLLERLRDTFQRPTKEVLSYVPSPEEQRLLSLGVDPIEQARGERGYVFPAFSALGAWGTTDQGKPVWSEFCICAFKEALKTINQFKAKTQERVEKRQQAEGELSFMISTSSRPQDWPKARKEAGIKVNSETEDSEKTPAILGSDPRYQKLRKILGKLSDQIEEDTQNPHACLGPTLASLRSWRDVRKSWLTITKKSKGTPLHEDLLVALAEQQKQHRFDFGYVSLFRELADEENHELWQEPSPEQELEYYERGWSFALLRDAAKARALAEEAERSKEPIRFTPAEPTHSRRLHMLSDMPGSDAVKYPQPGQALTSIVVKDGAHYRRQRVRLTYSAPRLLRDGLGGGAAEARWLQPMMAGLGIHLPDQPVLSTDGKKPKDPALALMPDRIGRNQELRMLLNFPVTLEVSWLHQQIAQLIHPQFTWTNFQFNGSKDEQLHLYWPGMKNCPKDQDKDKNKKAWWTQPDLHHSGITSLSVDIGQRRAGDWAVLETHAFSPEQNPSSPFFVKIGETETHAWHSRLRASGSFLLPGEGQKVYLKGKLVSEPHGSRGRRVRSQEEHEEALTMARILSGDEDQFDAASWVGHWDTDKKQSTLSYPEQNDKLNQLFRRALSQLRKWHRWTWLVQQDPQQAAREILLNPSQLPFKEAAGTLQDNKVSGTQLDKLKSELDQAYEQLRSLLCEQLNLLANRILPLRDGLWSWVEQPSATLEKNLHKLETRPLPEGAPTPWIKGQRGLSFARLEQLDNFRRLLLSLNRLLSHSCGEKPAFGTATFGDELPDPCPVLTEKLNRMRAERVNQTAHLILAQALGLQLKAPHQDLTLKAKDIHGTYERIPGRKPVDFIVIENLSRYQFDTSRAPSENGRLMKWCHRAIRDKVLEMSKIFNIPLIETPAAYTSKVDARTGAPGFRVNELTFADLKCYYGNRITKNQNNREQYLSDLTREIEESFSSLKEQIRIVVPRDGGTHFLAATPPNQPPPKLRQADMNAAVNIGLRALAAPHCFHAHPRIRLTAKGENYYPRASKQANKREQVLFPISEAKKAISFKKVSSDFTQEIKKQTYCNLFHDPLGIAQWGFADHDVLSEQEASFALQKSLLGRVKQLAWPLCENLNRQRLAKLGITFPKPDRSYFSQEAPDDPIDPDDEIPM